MVSIFLFVLFLLAAVGVFFVGGKSDNIKVWMRIAASAVLVVIALACAISTSTLTVEKDKFAVFNRVYMAESLPMGRIMMVGEGENADTIYKGPQPKYLMEGFYVIPFVHVLNDVKQYNLIDVPANTYLKLIAREGKPLPKGEVMAPTWTDPVDSMIKPDYFLTHNGYKGQQLTVLPPGKYALHPALWGKSFSTAKATVVQTGEVGVVRSNVNSGTTCELNHKAETKKGITALLVERGCKGIWKEPLDPGVYYLHNDGYTVTNVSTRTQIWKYQGGYTRRDVNLTVAKDGSITQDFDDVPVACKPEYADCAVLARTKDGQTVPMEARIQVQVRRMDAPLVVAGTGSLDRVEDRVGTPIINDVIRAVAGVTDAGDLVSKRSEINKTLAESIIPEAAKAGVTVTEARLGEVVIPSELLLPDRRSKLASSLKDTYEQERLAAEDRKATEKAIAEADKQDILVTADFEAQAEETRADGKAKAMDKITKATSRQVAVLGRDRTIEMQQFNRVMEALEKQPELVKTATIQVGDSNGGMEGAAAILGGTSNISKFLQSVSAPKGK